MSTFVGIKHFIQAPAVLSGENLKLVKSLTGEEVKSDDVSSEDLVQPTKTESEVSLLLK